MSAIFYIDPKNSFRWLLIMADSKIFTLDYLDLFSHEKVSSIFTNSRPVMLNSFPDMENLRYTFGDGTAKGILESVKLRDDIFLILNHTNECQETTQNQLITDGGWIHIQFRVNGHGKENIGPRQQFIDTPENSFFICSYPKSTVITRETYNGGAWKSACLYLRPGSINNFFGVSKQAFPDHLSWISASSNTAKWFSSGINPSSLIAINDMLGCSFNGHARTTFMRAKSTELIASLLHSFETTADYSVSDLHLTARDIACIKTVKDLIHESIDQTMTLQSLAKMVGLNRTKLALGFKSVFGSSLQSYWRDIRLSRAQELLRMEDLSVSEVSARVGYSEPSSFTRAFIKKYGIQPKNFKSSAVEANLQLERN